MHYSFTIENKVLEITMINYQTFSSVVPLHQHGDGVFEIHYVTDGAGIVEINNQVYQLTPNTLYITGPGVPHKQLPQENGTLTEFGLFLIIPPHLPSDKLLYSLNSHTSWIGNASKKLYPLFENIIKEYKTNHMGHSDSMSFLLGLFFIECIRSFSLTRYQANTLPKPTSFYITHTNNERNTMLLIDEIFLFEYATVTLETLAKRLKLSKRQTQRLIQNKYGISFSQKKLHARMSAATTMLNNTSASISSISSQLGYSSIEHFSKAFSNYYNCSPSTYRKAHYKSSTIKQPDSH